MSQITLKATRESCGYTVGEVAEHCDITKNELIDYEDDPGKLPSSIVMKLRGLYGIPIDYIRI